MRGVVGLLYLIGGYRSQHESLRSLWSSSPSGRAIFPASFGRNRFEQVIANLRFDSREDRNTEDKFAAFRQMRKQFIDNCRKQYAVSAFVTVDEQLIPFRGHCSFWQYMPSKPDKYGIKLFCSVTASLDTLSMGCHIVDVKEIIETLACQLML